MPNPPEGYDKLFDDEDIDIHEHVIDDDEFTLPKNSIIINRTDLHPRQPSELYKEVFDKLLETEKSNPTLYWNDGWVTIQPNENKMHIINKDDMAHILSDRLQWYKKIRVKKDIIPVPIKSVPEDIVKSVFVNPRRCTEIPKLKSVVSHPITTDTGLRTIRKYLKEHQTFLTQSFPNIKLFDSMEEAKSTFLEPFSHFPFDSSVDQATAVSFSLTLLVRHLIQGLTPLFHFSASTAGTGKTRLCQSLYKLVEGDDIPQHALTYDSQMEKVERNIMSTLVSGIPAFLFDNLKSGSTVSSPQLAQLITAKKHAVKVLYEQSFREIESKCVWAISGNSLNVEGDMSRRTVHVKLSTDEPHPHLRTGLPDIDSIITRDREKLLSALLTPVRQWMKDGKPTNKAAFGSFEQWDEIINGILSYWNMSVTRKTTEDNEYTAYCEFIKEIYNDFGDTKWKANQVLHFAFGEVGDYIEGTEVKETLVDLLSSRDRRTSVKLGYMLKSIEGRVFEIEPVSLDADMIKVKVSRVPKTSPAQYQITEIQP